MAITEVFSGIAVADYPAAEAYYERVFGRPPDMRPNDGEGAWQLAGPGWVYVVAEPEHAGHSLLTLLVDDLDAVLEGLRERDLEPEVETIPDIVRTARLHDPDGNRITFGQPFVAGAGEPAAGESGAEGPVAGEPGAAEPVAGESVAEESAAEEPAGGESAAAPETDDDASKPGAPA